MKSKRSKIIRKAVFLLTYLLLFATAAFAANMYVRNYETLESRKKRLKQIDVEIKELNHRTDMLELDVEILYRNDRQLHSKFKAIEKRGGE
jgi:hypothetical protein